MKKVTLGILACTSILIAGVNIESCKSCHGVDFEKAALGKSKIVKDMTKSEVSAALIGYKNGTYGDSMKGIMYSNVKMYTNKELSTTGIGSNEKIQKKGLESSIDLKSCKGCHGVDFEKAALGKSKIVRDMTKSEVSAALIGYKNGTYGDSMKGIMYQNVKMYTNKELSTTGIGVNNVTHKEPIKSSIDLTSCKGCHGVDFEKASLGSSKVVRDMTKEEVTKALLGYKNGTYGGSMKGVMTEKVKNYTEKELRTTGLGK
jgi:cytochrome c-type protein NapB